MPAMIPPGCRAHLLGSAATLDGLSAFIPLEEGAAEGTMMLMELRLDEYPTDDTLAELAAALAEQGVEPWPGYSYTVFVDGAQPVLYIAWMKGLAWMPVILGILAVTLLPPLLMAAVWWLLPESVTSMIEGLFSMGLMLLVMWLMMKMLPAIMPTEEKPKEVAE
ncbi:MAG: hypothetical protein SVP26_03155 [Chloroflexota bacterium]|nr:hypothetical protein [Chloroflexota bacterium]